MSSEQLAWLIRRHAIEMTSISGGSHIGSIMSVADIVAVLYADILKYNSQLPDWDDRDRFILSKGHAGAAIYSALAECGFFNTEELLTHYQNGSRLSGHVSHHLPGVDFSTGSLGHGLSAAVGMSYAFKKDNKQRKTFVVLGDGECDEGSVWEAALFANHFRLNNLCVIVDKNQMQSLDFTENTMELLNLEDKWKAFGWNVITTNGNNHTCLKDAFRQFNQFSNESPHKPTVIIANTIKGYGVSYMQNNILWHYRFPHQGWEYNLAVAELHDIMPSGVNDPYTPNGISEDNQYHEIERNNNVYTNTWMTSYPEQMKRVDAESGSTNRVKKI